MSIGSSSPVGLYEAMGRSRGAWGFRPPPWKITCGHRFTGNSGMDPLEGTAPAPPPPFLREVRMALCQIL